MTKKQATEKWKKLEEILFECREGEAIISSLKELYSIFDSSMFAWLGGLFDSDIGGFYYSNSAKEGDNFFPDIESTGQAIGILEYTGVIKSYKDIPESVRSKIACFICSCEDPESGYFYNLQWSKEEVDKKLARRSRDSRWAVDLAEMCNFKIPHPTVFSRIKSGVDSSAPQFLKNEEEFNKYLFSLDWKNEIYKNMHILVSQFDQIIEAGLGDAALSHIASLQNPQTGLFAEEYLDADKTVKVLRTAITFYYVMKKPIPMAEKVLDYAIKRIKEAGDYDMSYIASGWGTVAKVVCSLTELGGLEGAIEARRILTKHTSAFPELILSTAGYLKRFKKPDGSFSYLEKSSSPTSQTMPVAKKNSYEGDINGTILAISVARNVIKMLTLNKLDLPIYNSDDFNEFIKTVEKN